MNIVQHNVFTKYPDINIAQLLLWESVVQFIAALSLFWVDFTIPCFGTSASIDEFMVNMRNGIECFFFMGEGRCYASFPIGVLFAIAYCMSYYFGSLVIREASANSNVVINSITAPITVILWFVIPPMTAWAGAPPYTPIDIVSALCGLPFIFLGSVMYHYYETQTIKYTNQSNDAKDDPFIVYNSHDSVQINLV